MAMVRDAWIELARHRIDKVWERFDEAFQFRPSVRPEDWPSFREPVPSITWRVSDLLAEFDPWRDARAAPYNLALLSCLQAFVPEDEPVLALDWQHAAYAFYPHRLRKPQEVASWCIPALPSGEYHLFVTEDHRLGSLGHPWEQTVCVFGAGFVDEYRHLTPLPASQIIRQQLAEVDRPHRGGRKSEERQPCPRRRFGRRG
jgi:hypothetical protein